MTMRCPYLGLEADRSQALPEATSRHRCYKVPAEEAGKPGRPERVGAGYQAQVCLGQAHFRCPRLKPLIEPKGTESTEGRAGSRVASVVSRGGAAKAATSGGGAESHC